MNIITYNRTEKVSSVLYFLDAEKAFDGVESDYLTTVLAKMGFGRKLYHRTT